MTLETGLGCFKKAEEPIERQKVDDRPSEESRRRGDRGPKLLCKLCRARIATRGDAVEVEGRHQHTFFNPAGILFEIGCFAQAVGCRVSGQPTAEFSWFKGCRWQYSSCSSCDAHLGWFFSGAGGGTFHGLILNRLIEVEEEGK